MSGAYEGWAIVELMGHRKRAGRVSEVEQFGAALLRIDIPAGEDTVTEFYGGGAIYALRPCSEELARRVAANLGDVRPIAPSTLRIAAPAHDDDEDTHVDEDGYEDFTPIEAP